MKHTPYTVPEGFFEKAATQAEKRGMRIRSRRKALLASVAGTLGMAILLVLVNPFAQKDEKWMLNQLTDKELVELADLFEYDIFLNP